MRLTRAGERLLAEARAVLDAVERTRTVAAELAADNRQTLHLGITRAFDARTYQLLDDLSETAPDVRVRLHRLAPDERLAAVRSGEPDAADVRVLDGAPGLDFTALWTNSLMAAVPLGHPLAEHESLTLGQLAGLPLRLAPQRNNPAFHTCRPARTRDSCHRSARPSRRSRQRCTTSQPVSRPGRCSTRSATCPERHAPHCALSPASPPPPSWSLAPAGTSHRRSDTW
ncbi:LysR substrate-binding domain-containing protein [Streptomyces sp. NPDC046712]|uniref:LysR substrate-binding domain-containing protein n=1 Tax=Streptomyces sp. NPDC046712 TaxID=3154802 RepID=UPI0033F8D3AE